MATPLNLTWFDYCIEEDMIKHIVLFKLHDFAEGRDKAGNAQLAKQQIEALAGRIPGLLKIEVGIDFLHSATSSDLVVYAELEDHAALTVYQEHPEHQPVLRLVRALASERRAVDYEV
jgi:hypothetical protein